MPPNLYRYTRTSIQSGDIFGTASPALFSRIIRIFTKSKVSHVGIFIWLKNRLFCVELLEGNGCVLTPASSRLTGQFYWWKLHTEKHREQIIEDCLDDVGRIKYSLWGAVFAPLANIPDSDNICSEFVARKLDIKFDQLDRGILPIDIMNKCEKVTLVTK